jgi:hypothetical protein
LTPKIVASLTDLRTDPDRSDDPPPAGILQCSPEKNTGFLALSLVFRPDNFGTEYLECDVIEYIVKDLEVKKEMPIDR